MNIHDFSVDVAPTVQAAVSVVALISIGLLWWQIKKSNDWNRINATFTLMNMSDFYRLEEIATKCCSDISIPFPSTWNRQEALRVRGDYNAYHAVKNFVIFLERICIAFQAGYADRDVIAHTFGPIIVGYEDHLGAYIAEARAEMKSPESYQSLTNVAVILQSSMYDIRRGFAGGDFAVWKKRLLKRKV